MVRAHLWMKHTRIVDPHKPLNPRFHPLGQPGPEFGGLVGFLNKVPHGFRTPLAFLGGLFVMYQFRASQFKYGARSVWNVQLPIHADPVVDHEWDWRYRTQFDALNFGHVYKAIHNERLRKAGLLDEQGNFLGELPDYVKPGAPIPAIPQHPDDQDWVNYVLMVDKGIDDGLLPPDFHHFNVDDYFWKLEELKEADDQEGALKLLMPFYLTGFGHKDMSDLDDAPDFVKENATPGLELWFKPSRDQATKALTEYLDENLKR